MSLRTTHSKQASCLSWIFLSISLLSCQFVSGLAPTAEMVPSDHTPEARHFFMFELEDFLQHEGDISESEMNARLEHQFNLLDEDQDGLLSQHERKELWVDFLQPVANKFFPETEILTFDQFCEKDHHLVPSQLLGDEHFFTVEQVCQWEKDLSDESCENDWQLMFEDADEISRTEFIQRFVEVLNNDKAWTFAIYKELIMSQERKHLRNIIFSADEKSLVPINEYSRKSDHHCAKQDLVSRRELEFVMSALIPIVTILVTSLISATFSGINAGCEGSCLRMFDEGRSFNLEAALIESSITLTTSVFMGTTCVISSGAACFFAGVGTGVIKSLAQGTICQLQPNEWNYSVANAGCAQECCWQPATMLKNVAINSASALIQTSAFKSAADTSPFLKDYVVGAKGMSSWSWKALADVKYGFSDMGSSFGSKLASRIFLSEVPYLPTLYADLLTSQIISEYKQIVLQPNPFANQAALLDEVRRDIDEKNLGIPCGQYCSHDGQCSFCGNAYCCEKGVVSHGCDGSVGGDSMRVCVPMTISESANTMDSFREREMIQLRFTHLQLDNMPWCNTQNPHLPKPEIRLHWELKMPLEYCTGNGGLLAGGSDTATAMHAGVLFNDQGPFASNARMIMSKDECILAARMFSNEPLRVDHTWENPPGCSIYHHQGKRYPVWRTLVHINEMRDEQRMKQFSQSSRICYRHDPVKAEVTREEFKEESCGFSPRPGCPDSSWIDLGEIAGGCYFALFYQYYRWCEKYTFECPSGYSVQRMAEGDADAPQQMFHGIKKESWFRRIAFCRKDDNTWDDMADSRDPITGRIIYPVWEPQPEFFCADTGYELDSETVEFETFDAAMVHCLSSDSCGAVYEHKPLNCRFFADVAYLEEMHGAIFDMPKTCDYVQDAKTGLQRDKFYAIKLTDPSNFCPIQSDPDARVSNFKTLRASGNFVMLEGKTFEGNTVDCRDRYNYFTYFPLTTDQGEVWNENDSGWANLAGFVHGFDVPARQAGVEEIPDNHVLAQNAHFIIGDVNDDVLLSEVAPLIIPSQSMECTIHPWTTNFQCPEHSAIEGFFIHEPEEISHVKCCEGVIQRSCHWESLSNPGRMECSNAGYVWAGMRSSRNTGRFEFVDEWLCCEVPPVILNAAMIHTGQVCPDQITEFQVADVIGPTFNLVEPYIKQCHEACEQHPECTHFSYLPVQSTLNDMNQITNGRGSCALYHSGCEVTEQDDANVLLFQMNKRMQILDVLSQVIFSGCSLKGEATWTDIQEPIGRSISNLHGNGVYACAQACSAHGYSIMTFEDKDSEHGVTKCLCKDNVPGLVSCGDLDLSTTEVAGQPQFQFSSSPDIRSVFTIASVSKITAVSTNNGTLFVDIGRARFNELFDNCPVVALNTAEGQQIYRRTADWTNALDAYSLFTYEFHATGNIGGDYVTYTCSNGSCEVQDVRQWLDLDDIKSRHDNPDVDLFLFPGSKCPTNYDINMAPCDPVPARFDISDALNLYNDKIVRIQDDSGASFSTTYFNQIPSLHEREEITLAGEVEFEHAGCAWDCDATGTVFPLGVNVDPVAACTQLAIDGQWDSFAIDSSGACVLTALPDSFAFDTCPTDHSCFKNHYKRVMKWEEFECSTFYPVADKNSNVFQSCRNDPIESIEATEVAKCQMFCDFLRGCSYFMFAETQSRCLLFSTCDLSYERDHGLSSDSVLMHRGVGDVVNDQKPRFLGIDGIHNQPNTMSIRSIDSREEAYVSCPVGYMITSCSCALDSCRGASVSGRYCVAYGDFTAAEVECMKETFVHSHGIVTQDTVSFDCGSETLLGCVCSSQEVGDCSVELKDGRCVNKPLSTSNVGWTRSCDRGSCSDGWQHLRVLTGYSIEIQTPNSRITIPKGAYTVEAQRKMLPVGFDWNDVTNIIAINQGDDRIVQGICADVSPTNPPSLSPTVDPSLNPTLYPSTNPSIDPTNGPTQMPTLDPSLFPTIDPSFNPSFDPTEIPTLDPSIDPSIDPTLDPSMDPSVNPSLDPTIDPSFHPSLDPTFSPTLDPVLDPTIDPSADPTFLPSLDPTLGPSLQPSLDPSMDPSMSPSIDPTLDPILDPTVDPTNSPSLTPTFAPTQMPTLDPSASPTHASTTYSEEDPMTDSTSSAVRFITVVQLCIMIIFLI